MADDEVAKQLQELNKTLKQIFLPNGLNILRPITENLAAIAQEIRRKQG